jgi:hypothetical protein
MHRVRDTNGDPIGVAEGSCAASRPRATTPGCVVEVFTSKRFQTKSDGLAFFARKNW